MDCGTCCAWCFAGPVLVLHLANISYSLNCDTLEHSYCCIMSDIPFMLWLLCLLVVVW